MIRQLNDVSKCRKSIDRQIVIFFRGAIFSDFARVTTDPIAAAMASCGVLWSVQYPDRKSHQKIASESNGPSAHWRVKVAKIDPVIFRSPSVLILCTYSRLICIQFYIIINGGKSYKDITSDLCRSKSIAAVVRADNEFNITSTEHTYILHVQHHTDKFSAVQPCPLHNFADHNQKAMLFQCLQLS